jgi:MtrB/PioB family decaheme-associated outer membrane protein
MRMSSTFAAVALALLPLAAQAQTTPASPQSAPATQPAMPAAPAAPTGFLDFGVRGTTSDGDAARYERYRDLGDGLFLDRALWVGERSGWLMNLSGRNVGRRDQKFSGSFVRPGKFVGWGDWDQIPMLMSRTTMSLFEGFTPDLNDPTSVLDIPNDVMLQVQATDASNPNTSVVPTLFNQNAIEFDTESIRRWFTTGFRYIATPEFTIRTDFRYSGRNGTLPYGASFGHSALVEFPAPLEHRQNDFETNAEYSNDRVLLRGGYIGSWFHNENTTVTVDTPFRAFDNASNSSRGRLSLPPSNTYFAVTGMASVRMPARSRATAFISVGSLKDAGDPLMPQTINADTSPLPVDRTDVGGEARTVSYNLSFVSRPSRWFDVNVRFRSYDYDNRTEELHMVQRVAYDNSPNNATYSSLGAVSSGNVHSEPFGVVRHNFDADFRYLPRGGMSAGVGFTLAQEDRTHRFFEESTENVFRLTFDTVGNRWFSVRTRYEHGERSADVHDESEIELFTIGEQPGIRHFDVAQRDRDRVTIIGTVIPGNNLLVNASLSVGKDDYFESLFGLRDNNHQIYSIGMDVTPSPMYSFSGSYSYENYDALSRSRQADPPGTTNQPCPPTCPITYEQYLGQAALPASIYQVADQRRNWATDSTDRAHSVLLGFNVNQIKGKVDVAFTYDYSRARAQYNYITGPVADRTLPEETPDIDSTLPDPTQLPEVKSDLHRATLDGVYSLTSRIGIGLTWWFEDWKVEDFALDADSGPLARTNAVLLGYLYRPYTANTFWARMIYRW